MQLIWKTLSRGEGEFMTTELDKQAREFWRIWADDRSPVPQCLNQEIEFAAAFATQVREQTAQECAGKICIEVGPKLFEFTSFNNWCDKARSRFVGSGHTMYTSICIDAKGRLCMSGKEFMRADKDKAFPVSVYAIAPAPPQTTEQEER